MQKTEVLIIGAGPTGLVLALWLTKGGVKVRIIDKAEKAGTTSRALVIHARSLEFYKQLDIADIVTGRGVEIKGVNLLILGRREAHVQFNDLHMAVSPYQFMMAFPQDQQEDMLEKQLLALGVNVERSTELISFEQKAEGIHAQLLKAGGAKEDCEARFLAGCDGAHSIVRQKMEAGFPGGTYEETYYVADLKCSGLFEPGDVNIALDDADFLAIFPINGKDEVRLVGTIRTEAAAMKREEVKWEDVSENIIKRLNIDVKEIKWFSTYRVHHRVASHFHDGNAFLLGDAGHIHSPVGGQGMNTGIGDAVNLAWKLVSVIKDNAPLPLLDTYEPERIAFARRLVATTDRAFTFVSARGRLARWVRLNVVPFLLPLLFSFVFMRRLLFRTVSQLSIKYPNSALSEGSAGKIKGGQRLPWVQYEPSDNFACLSAMKWLVHIYGDNSSAVRELCDMCGLKLHIFPYDPAAAAAGLKKNAVYVIRPDGYIGMADAEADLNKISAYLDKWRIKYS